MSDELITSYVDIAAVHQQTIDLLKEISIAQEAFDKLNASRKSLGTAKGLPDISANIKKAATDTAAYTEEEKKLAAALKAREVAQKALLAAQAKGTELLSETSAEIAKQNILNSQQVKANKEVAQSVLGTLDSYQQLKKTYDAAAASAKNLSAIALKTGNSGDQSAAAGANAQAKALHDQLLQIETAVGQSQRNVGNYTGAIKVLQAAFAEATAKLNSLSTAEQQNSAAGQKLQKEVSLLGTLVGQQEKGFVSLRREVANSTQALAAMEASGLANTAGFKELQTEVSNSKRELNEFNAQQKLLSSESPKIAALTTVAKGLGAAYAVGAGAASLLADGDEHLQKELNKLVAVMTLLQGLTEFNAVMQERFAIATALSQSKTQLLNVAMKVQAALAGVFAASTQAEAIAAQEAAIAITEEATAAEAAAISNAQLAASAGVTEGALIAEGTGAEIATAATTTFTTALIATGIGAIIAAIAAAVVYLVVKMGEWKAETESMVKANAELNNSLGELVSATKEYEAIRAVSAQRELKDLQTLVDSRKAAGVTALQGLALDKKISEEKLKTANDDAKRYNITKESLKTAQDLAKRDAAVVVLAEKDKQKLLKETADQEDKNFVEKLDHINNSIKLRKEEAATSKSVFEFANATFQEQTDAKNAIDLNSIQASKLSADDRRKLILESARIESDIIQTKNTFILSNERSTLDQRLAAIRSNAAEQKKVIQAELASTLSDPTVSGADKTIAKRKAGEQTVKVTKETNKAIFDQEDTDRKRSAKAQADFDKFTLDADKATQDQIISNGFTSSDEKVNAIIESSRDQQAAIKVEYEFTKSQSILSKAELEALDLDYQNKQIAIARETAKQIKAIQEKAKTDHIEISKLEQKEALDNQFTIDINALQRSFDLGLVAQGEYNKKRIDLEYAYAKQTLLIEIDALQKELDAVQLTNVQRAQITSQIASLERKLAEDSVAHVKKTEAEKVAAIQKTLGTIKDVSAEVFTFIGGILNANAVAQKNALDEQGKANEARAARDIEIVNASVLSQQDKAAKILIINARLQAQKEQIAQREKQAELSQAKFAKAVAIFNIVLSTTQAVIKAYTEGDPYTKVARAILAGVAGAAQLAVAIATPIPHFRHGKNMDNYEGPGYMNDGNKLEVLQRENGTIEMPTGLNILIPHIGRNDIIHPDKDAWMDAILGAAHRDANKGMKLAPQKSTEDKINATLIKGFAGLSNTIRNKREITIKGVSGKDIIFRDGNNTTTYLNQNLQ